LWVLKYFIRRFDDYVLVFLVKSSTVGNTVRSGSSGGYGGGGGGDGGGGGIVEFNECCVT
jgi:uncharacterized membrane protein YgcG